MLKAYEYTKRQKVWETHQKTAEAGQIDPGGNGGKTTAKHEVHPVY